MMKTETGHHALKLEPYNEISDEDFKTYIVNTYLVTEEKSKELLTEKAIRNTHKVSNHKQANSMIKAYEYSGIEL